jgi:hypothetical protein
MNYFRVKFAIEYNNRMTAILYSLASHNDVSVNDGLHIDGGPIRL